MPKSLLEPLLHCCSHVGRNGSDICAADFTLELSIKQLSRTNSFDVDAVVDCRALTLARVAMPTWSQIHDAVFSSLKALSPDKAVYRNIL
jgi:hypothetical protein